MILWNWPLNSELIYVLGLTVWNFSFLNVLHIFLNTPRQSMVLLIYTRTIRKVTSEKLFYYIQNIRIYLTYLLT
jgi:hypothetical protein